jgi:hypothetical protein
MSGIPSTNTYIYLPGSALEVPGLEAILEYGDASAITRGHIPGALRINDRSMPDQIHVTELSGLQDDPDGRDSRINNADRHGERSGLMLYGGRTIGITGRVQAGNVHRMRDLWRRLRGQFGTIERDLLIHPPGEVPTYTNLLVNPSFELNANGWSAAAGETPTFTGGFTGTGTVLNVAKLQVNGLPANTTARVQADLAIPWDGSDVYLHALVKVQTANQAIASISVSALSDLGSSGGGTGALRVTSPTAGNWYELSGVIPAASLIPIGTNTLAFAIDVLMGAATGNIIIYLDKLSMVYLAPGQSAPIGWVDGDVPGFQWAGNIATARSYGPAFAVNQIADSTCTSPGSWTATNTAGVTIQRGPVSFPAWAGALTSRSILYWPVSSASGQQMSIAAPRTPVVIGHTYRLTARVKVTTSNVGQVDAAIQWYDANNTLLSTSSQALAGAGEFDVSLTAVAPAGALSAIVLFGNVVHLSTAGSQNSTFLVADPCLVDVTYTDPGAFVGTSDGAQEVAMLGAGARRRIARPFLVKGVRKTSDMRAPEQQTSMQSRRAFTMSLRASDPRIYVLDQRRASMKLVGSPQFVSKQAEVFTTGTGPAPVPTGFTYEGQNVPSDYQWVKNDAVAAGSTPLVNHGVGLLGDLTTFPAADVVARMYRSAEGYTYTNPRVVLGGSPAQQRTYPLPSVGWAVDQTVTFVGQNSLRILLKRVNSTTWLELRWNVGAHVSTQFPNSVRSTQAYTFELWCSHNTSGTLTTTRLAQADYASVDPTVVVNLPFDPLSEPRWLVATLLNNVVTWELWTTYPGIDTSTRIESGTFSLPAPLQTIVGSSVAGQTGMSMYVPRIDSTTYNFVAYAPPMAHYFEASKADVAPQSMNIPVIGTVDTPELVTLRGDVVDPVVSMTVPNEDGTTRSVFARLVGTMADANPVTIDLGSGAITDSQGNNAYGSLQPGGSLTTLQPGVNTISVAAANWNTAASEHLAVAWKDALT